MRKLIITILISNCGFLYSQYVGIGTELPSAMLDVVSKNNTNETKALEVNNSSSVELLKVTNTGMLGINIGNMVPGALLDVNSGGNLNIRHEHLPVLSLPDYTAPFYSLGVNSESNAVGSISSIQYLYFQNSSVYPSSYNLSTNTGGFSLSDSNQYVNIPIMNDVNLRGNTVGATFGSDASATVNGRTVNNVNYIIIPNPGVYQFEFYGTVRCNRYNNTQTYTQSGQMQVNTVFATATGSNTYSINTIYRGLMTGIRNNLGATSNVSYAYANPQTLVQVVQTTVPNQKVALFLQYVGGEPNQFSNSECLFNIPAGANFSYFFIMTKM